MKKPRQSPPPVPIARHPGLAPEDENCSICGDSKMWVVIDNQVNLCQKCYYRFRRECIAMELDSGTDYAITAPRLEVAPWPDFAGNPIHEGDTIQHPYDGMTGVVFVLSSEKDPSERWRVMYGSFDPGRVSRLCLQIGDKGRAVVVGKSVPKVSHADTKQDPFPTKTKKAP